MAKCNRLTYLPLKGLNFIPSFRIGDDLSMWINPSKLWHMITL